MQGPQPVVEFFNVFLGHYFMTLDNAEIADIDGGMAGPGWVRTGYAFDAFPVGMTRPASYTTVDVSRFYSRLSNSHFFTADPVEAAGLNHPGSEWAFEDKRFAIAVPDANGVCPAFLQPVYRFYNNRFAFNDSNHRYVTSQAERERMRSLGWIDEGVRYCTPGVEQIPIKAFAIGAGAGPLAVRPSAQCEDESVNIGPCIAVNNLAAPDKLVAVPRPIAPGSQAGFEFYDRTGMYTQQVYVVDPSLPTDSSAQDVFVQQGDAGIGVHVDTLHRGPNSLSSVNPLNQLPNSKGPGLRDDRFFPFGAYESDVELALSLELRIRKLSVRSPGGAAYGHPTLEFVDVTSGHHLYFTVLTYGTVPEGDYLALDTGTGKVIVGTSFRPDASYGRSLGDRMLPFPLQFDEPNITPANHGVFEFRMGRSDFRKVLADARTLDPSLSAQPADYLLDNFHLNDEVFGDGEIGLLLQRYDLRLLRR